MCVQLVKNTRTFYADAFALKDLLTRTVVFVHVLNVCAGESIVRRSVCDYAVGSCNGNCDNNVVGH